MYHVNTFYVNNLVELLHRCGAEPDIAVVVVTVVPVLVSLALVDVANLGVVGVCPSLKTCPGRTVEKNQLLALLLQEQNAPRFLGFQW